MEMAVDEGSVMGLGLTRTGSNKASYSSSSSSSSSSTPIDSSNIGFQLLKKHGWKEGTGLGVSQQGRLEPVQAFIKKNKRGLGADKPKKAIKHPKTNDSDFPKLTKSKAKGMSKKMKKLQEFEKQLQEKEFDRAFMREFWPDNV